jgi:putative glutamine amidotransferase
MVTTRRAPAGADAAAVERVAVSARCYADAVREAGGEPILVAAGDRIPDHYDGLLLSGGADVHPRFYGQSIDESIRDTLTIDDARDALEVPVARKALEDDLPVLSICRGIQVLNVAAGGTLWQDLSLAQVSPRFHNQDGRLESWEYGQQVVVEIGTLLAGMVGQGFVGVNTYHHQAVGNPAPGFRVTALAPDGVIEGIESTHHRFAVGVQWHPERLVKHHRLHRGLFARFVEAARER